MTPSHSLPPCRHAATPAATPFVHARRAPSRVVSVLTTALVALVCAVPMTAPRAQGQPQSESQPQPQPQAQAVQPSALYAAGLRVAALPYRGQSMPVAVTYPTRAPEAVTDLGPYRLMVAKGAPPAPQSSPATGWPVVFVSHGTGGSLFGHADLVAGLARAGHVVVSLEHPGDNYRDRSLVGDPRYLTQRPAQLLAVMRAALDADGDAGTAMRALIGDVPVDARRVAVIGHSAGGYTAAAVAGARGSAGRVTAHCAAHAQDDPMCALRDPRAHVAPGFSGPRFTLPPDAPMPVSLHEPRVRAAVLMAPLTVPLEPESLAAVPARLLVMGARSDAVLPARFHFEPWARWAPAAQRVEDTQAGHYGYMTSVPPERRAMLGPAGQDPDGFDRAAFQRALVQRIAVFLDGAR